jgi:hypothetical protein
MKRPIKNGYVMDVLLCRSFFPAKRKTLRWAKRRVNKDDRRQAQRQTRAETERTHVDGAALVAGDGIQYVTDNGRGRRG